MLKWALPVRSDRRWLGRGDSVHKYNTQSTRARWPRASTFQVHDYESTRQLRLILPLWESLSLYENGGTDP